MSPSSQAATSAVSSSWVVSLAGGVAADVACAAIRVAAKAVAAMDPNFIQSPTGLSTDARIEVIAGCFGSCCGGTHAGSSSFRGGEHPQDILTCQLCHIRLAPTSTQQLGQQSRVFVDAFQPLWGDRNSVEIRAEPNMIDAGNPP